MTFFSNLTLFMTTAKRHGRGERKITRSLQWEVYYHSTGLQQTTTTYLNLRLDVVVVVAEEVRPRASHDGDVVDPLVPLHDLLVHGRRLRPTALEGPRHRVVVVHHVHALAALPHLSRKVDRVLFGVGIGVGDDANTVVRDGINKIK